MPEPIPRTELSQELDRRSELLERIEAERLAAESPPDLDRADDLLDVAQARLDAVLADEQAPSGALADAVCRLAGVVADLLAAVVQRDEEQEERYRIPLTSAPGMIDAFDDSFQFPADMGVAGWRSNQTPVATWRFALEKHVDHARAGVAAARIGTTMYHDSPQSNSAAVVQLLAHVLSMAVWLEDPPLPHGQT